MTKLGTPIGAGPKVATVKPGLVGAGEPSGLRSAGCSIFWLSSLAVCLAPWPFLLCLLKRPEVLPPPVFVPALPPPEPPPPGLLVPVAVVVLLPVGETHRDPPRTVQGIPPEPVLPPEGAGAWYSDLSAGLLQPGSLMSVRPSPSSSERFEHSGSAAEPGPATEVVPTLTVPEIAVPAAMIARVAPSAMITRTF